jgi:hypothetical protein
VKASNIIKGRKNHMLLKKGHSPTHCSYEPRSGSISLPPPMSMSDHIPTNLPPWPSQLSHLHMLMGVAQSSGKSLPVCKIILMSQPAQTQLEKSQPRKSQNLHHMNIFCIT